MKNNKPANAKPQPTQSWPSILTAAPTYRLRSKKQIWDAEGAFWDLVWYGRKLDVHVNVRDGLETLDPEIEKGMLENMRKVEARFGGRENLMRQYHNGPFHWGMIHGKFSALRWVLGEEWDQFDT